MHTRYLKIYTKYNTYYIYSILNLRNGLKIQRETIFFYFVPYKFFYNFVCICMIHRFFTSIKKAHIYMYSYEYIL